MKTLLTTNALLLAATTTSFAQQTTAATEATPVCTAPHQDARVLGVPSVDAPTNADGAGGTSEKISESSGNFLLDTAALRATRFFKYRPEMQHCEGLPGSYLIDFTF